MCAVEAQSSLGDSSEPIKHPESIANQKGPGVHPEWVPPNPRTFPSEEHRGAVPICFWRALREGLDAGTPPPHHATPGRGELEFGCQRMVTRSLGPVSATSINAERTSSVSSIGCL